MVKRILSFGVLFSALLAGCSEDVVGPGNIARPLVGSYDLESRTIASGSLTDTSRHVLNVLVPPQVRGLLRLGADGRYGQVDTIFVADSTTVHILNGRWSVLNDVFYFVTNDNQQREDRYTYDGLRLVRISEGNRLPSGQLFSVTDVWLRRQPDQSSADE